MNTFTTEEEQLLLQALSRSDEKAFRRLYEAYYGYLSLTAYRYLSDAEKAKDFAQDTFVELWKRRESLVLKSNLKAYLRQVTVNKCLNYLKREKRIDFSENSALPDQPTEADAHRNLEQEELSQALQKAIDQLPDKCRVVFCLSRFEEKSHKEISALLGISTKTIENQITRALKLLRQRMSRGIPILFLVLSNFFQF